MPWKILQLAVLGALLSISMPLHAQEPTPEPSQAEPVPPASTSPGEGSLEAPPSAPADGETAIEPASPEQEPQQEPIQEPAAAENPPAEPPLAELPAAAEALPVSSAPAEAPPALDAPQPAAAAVPETATGSLWVLFPEGSEAFLLAADRRAPLEPGREVRLPAGSYRIRIRHPDYRPLEQTVEIASGSVRVLLPDLEAVRGSPLLQRRAELEQRIRAMRRQHQLNGRRARIGALIGTVGLAGIGGLEWALAAAKSRLSEEYTRYRSASGPDAPGIWAGIVTQRERVNTLRAFELASLVVTGLGGGTGLACWLLRPSDAEFARATADIGQIMAAAAGGQERKP